MTALQLELRVLPGEFAVWRLPADAAMPQIEAGAFLSITRTPDEVSVVSVADAVPEGVRAEKGFHCLAVVGPLAFDITGIVAAVSAPLAAAGIPIFVVSTYDTDYVLVRSQYLDRAVQALTNAGFRITDQ